MKSGLSMSQERHPSSSVGGTISRLYGSTALQKKVEVEELLLPRR
jgi:hypothetical protein